MQPDLKKQPQTTVELTVHPIGFAFDAYAASVAEINFGIICACAPSLKAVFRRFFKETLSNFYTSHISSRLSSGSTSGNRSGFFSRSNKGSHKLSGSSTTSNSRIKLNRTDSGKGGTLKKQRSHSFSSPKNKMGLKWPTRRPDIQETTSFAKTHEQWTIESDRGDGTMSPIPVAYQPTNASSVLGSTRAPSEYSFATFQRWESGTDLPLQNLGSAPSTRESARTGMETIYVGRAI